MKFCAVIAEYNPFHNGHKYLLRQMKEQSGCDRLLCVMSGGFTQRGDMALLDKFTRASHAVRNGADAVIELPTPFAVSPAELFAEGAVHILASLPDVKVLAFGCESGSKDDFLRAANATLSEDKSFKIALKENMKDGTSYVKARTKTVLDLYHDIDEALLTSPNNILGVEYCRALLSRQSSIQPLPILRTGGGFKDPVLLKNFSSATAIRSALENGSKKDLKLLKGNLPADVLSDLSSRVSAPYRQAALCALLSASPEQLVKAPDCSEGLENKLRAMSKSTPDYQTLLSKVVSKRYTLSRLKRILLQNFLGIERKAVRDYLSAPLYCKVLAVRKKDSEELLSALSHGSFPLLVRKSDAGSLRREALACFNTDVHANELYCALIGKPINEYETLFV